MWCRHCKQETPAVGPATEHGPRCARCHRSSPEEPQAASHSAVALDGDYDDTRRAIYRTLRSAHASVGAGEASRTLRHDVGKTPLVEALSGPNDVSPAQQPSRVRARRPQRPAAPSSLPSTTAPSQLTAWLMGALGATSLGLGIGLGAWSLLGSRPELWNPALAAAIGGQGLLIVGLLQLLASLWNAARQASGKLGQMHDELRRLRRLADESAGRTHASAATFYADLSRDAPNERLVGALRGQLDELSARLR